MYRYVDRYIVANILSPSLHNNYFGFCFDGAPTVGGGSVDQDIILMDGGRFGQRTFRPGRLGLGRFGLRLFFEDRTFG